MIRGQLLPHDENDPIVEENSDASDDNDVTDVTDFYNVEYEVYESSDCEAINRKKYSSDEDSDFLVCLLDKSTYMYRYVLYLSLVILHLDVFFLLD